MAPSELFAGEVHTLDDHQKIIDDPQTLVWMQERMEAGDVVRVRNVVTEEKIETIKQFLRKVGMHSLPTYAPIAPGAVNHHRMNDWDERAYVKGCFHQFNFFPWNQDYFRLFEIFRSVYQARNLIAGNPPDKFLSGSSEDGCVARIAFQFYPSGGGTLNKHRDPQAFHQLGLPLMIMSRRGADFDHGGLYVERQDGSRIYAEDVCEPGDLFYSNAQVPHGVETIDPDKPLEWLNFEGRWMILFAVNKIAGTSAVSDAIDLDQAGD